MLCLRGFWFLDGGTWISFPIDRVIPDYLNWEFCIPYPIIPDSTSNKFPNFGLRITLHWTRRRSTQHRLDNGNFISSVSNLPFLCLLIYFVVAAVGLFGDHVYFVSPHSQSCDIKNNALLVFFLGRGRCGRVEICQYRQYPWPEMPSLKDSFLN